MEKQQNSRELIDILKAIGIIGVIVGHAAVKVPFSDRYFNSFIYLYHLMIFFFTAGYCFDEDKYKGNIELYFGRRIGSLLPKYFAYNFVFVLLHNFLCRIGILPLFMYYDFERILVLCTGGILFSTEEAVLSALWFIPVLLVASIIFGLIFSFSDKFKHRNAVLIVCALFFAAFGLYVNHTGIWLNYHIQTSLIAVPIMVLGWFARKNFHKIEKYFDWRMCILCTALMIVFIKCGGEVELYQNRTGFYAFYPITVIGISFCISLAKLLMRLPDALRRGISFIGRNSFHYMALHLVFFKLTDLVAVKIKNDPAEVLLTFTRSYQELDFLYPIAAIGGVSLLLILAKKIKSRVLAR